MITTPLFKEIICYHTSYCKKELTKTTRVQIVQLQIRHLNSKRSAEGGDLERFKDPFRVLLQYDWSWCIMSFSQYLFSSSHCFSFFSFHVSFTSLYRILHIVASASSPLPTAKLFGPNLVLLLSTDNTSNNIFFPWSYPFTHTLVYLPDTNTHTPSTSTWKIHIIF